MQGGGNLYSVFRTIYHEEVASFVSRIDKDFILLVPNEVKRFAIRALPMAAFGEGKRLALLDALKPSDSTGTVVVISYEDPPLLNSICDKLASVPRFRKYILVLPRITHLCSAAITRHSIGNQITLGELRIDLFPLDERTFVVPVSDTFANCIIENDITDVYTICRALAKLQLITGLPAVVKAAGPMSTKAIVLLDEMRIQIGIGNFSSDAAFDELIFVDRGIDLITPLLTQGTYGGLLDDQFDVTFDILDLPQGVTFNDTENTVIVSDNDPMFKEIRSLQVLKAMERVQEVAQEAKTIGEKMMEAKGTNKWRILAERAKELTRNMPYMNMHSDLLFKVTRFPSVFSDIKHFEDNCILGTEPDTDLILRLANRECWEDALRLLCLYSQTHRGVKSSFISKVENRFVSRFGPDFVREFIRLEIANLVKPQKGIFEKSTEPTFDRLTKELRLMNSENEPGLDTYYDGYIPPLARIVQAGVENGWAPGTPTRKIMDELGIETKTQVLHDTFHSHKKKRILVFVIGGVTQTERYLITELGKTAFNDEIEFHCGASSIINGKRFLKEVCPTLSRD